MKTEEVLLLALLRAGIKNEKLTQQTIAVMKEETMANVLSLSACHAVTALVSDVLLNQKLLEGSALKAPFEDSLMLSVFQYHQQDVELKRVCRLFEENQIYHIPLKGSVLRDMYREPWLRTSCDIDILIKPENLKEATTLLKNSGYVLDTHDSHDVSFFSEGGVRVELHYHLIEEDCHIGHADRILSKIWEHILPVEGYTYRCGLEKEMFYFYHIAHMAKHFKIGGCGIRPFLDVWVMYANWSFDEQALKSLLEEGKMTVFAKTVQELTAVWLDEKEPTEITRLMEEYLFRGGIYGSLNNYIAMEQVQKGSRRKSALAKVFLPYSEIKFYYPILQKNKWLLPFFEVYRWCGLIFKKENRQRSVKFLMLNHQLSKEEKKQAATLLNELELE